MPELPEVETTRLGLQPHLLGADIEAITLYRSNLRWAIPVEIMRLQGQTITHLERRAKYLLVHTELGAALWHLGMSGSLRVGPSGTEKRLHDHVDWRLSTGQTLRFHDPRRFGCLLFQAPDQMHPLLTHLAPEPLSDEFNAAYLQKALKGRKAPIKHVVMDQRFVVGVGNIYAAESLFAAGVRPQRAAGTLSKRDCENLVAAIKRILAAAITQGGTTLRDFINPDGEPGYFEQALFVYGREGKACKRCWKTIKSAELGNRQSCFCPGCQR